MLPIEMHKYILTFKEPYTGGGLSEADKAKLAEAAVAAIDVKIKNCGDFIRKLKTDKAEKDLITKEVNKDFLI